MVEYPKHVGFEEPYEVFGKWYERIIKDDTIAEPAAFTLATADAEGKPSCRVVLLKKYDERGFCFFTNLTSQKGKDLKDNPHAALLFYWPHLGQQIRIEGEVRRVSEKEGDDYFSSRRRGSQIGAWASKQSLIMKSDSELPERVKEVTEQFQGGVIPRPPFWSGFRLMPSSFEFWSEGKFRLHKRLLYTPDPEGWKINRLYP